MRKLSIAHAAWLGFCFAWMIMFWWWEYRFVSRMSDRTVGLYLFLVGYAITLLKGGLEYICGQGAFMWAYWLVGIPVAIVGITSTRPRAHDVMGTFFLCAQIFLGFEITPMLPS